jgi:hypothetical protein
MVRAAAPGWAGSSDRSESSNAGHASATCSVSFAERRLDASVGGHELENLEAVRWCGRGPRLAATIF